MHRIVDSHFPNIKPDLLSAAMEIFFDLREVPGLKKKPSASELLDWLKLLIADDLPPEALAANDIRTGVWLNPEDPQWWQSTPSVRISQELMAERMFPLTADGLQDAINSLKSRISRRHSALKRKFRNISCSLSAWARPVILRTNYTDG